MIIWLNGAFGSGKTQTAYELNRRLQNSYVYDPEEAGFFIRDNLPGDIKKSDFQDYPLWREFNSGMIRYISENYDGHIIIPMTVTNKQYYQEIIQPISAKRPVRHFILYASKKTLLKRLASRFESKRSWGAQQIDRCMKAFDHDITETKIYTDHLKIPQVAEEIASALGLSLADDKRSPFRKRIDRVVIQYKHIR
ncbi:MAG: AAA family ATPase [Oscillibacter sp.]|jgi:deoxyadenosine/deoxycytidine kinase|nr:AAA family ATPase [Oscillibacter sp.]MCI8689620.1 AAA family ATPase [Oscillibacter sp.]